MVQAKPYYYEYEHDDIIITYFDIRTSTPSAYLDDAANPSIEEIQLTA